MNRKSISFWICSFSLAMFLGCNDAGSGKGTGGETGNHTKGQSEHHEGDAHPSHGPHQGDLVELGDEQYHAEIVDDHDKGQVTIYILDSAAKKSVAIEAKEVVVNLTHDGKGEQFQLAASPEEGNAAGTSSRFVSTDPEFAEELDHSHGGTTLVVTIQGQQFRGKVHHDHTGHDHAGHDH